MKNSFLSSSRSEFEKYKQLGEKTFEQLNEEDFFWKQNAESNSIAALVRHLSGNMLSRWTDFLTTDGEKSWRLRDQEFDDSNASKAALIELWEKGWNCLFDSLQSLRDEDLEKTVTIRSQPLTVTAAINRQLTHYAYHVGQIVFIGKYLKGENWKSLSIAKDESVSFNAGMMQHKQPEMRKQ
jgi:hypothetical protein